MANDSSLRGGPADSRRVRVLYYITEGTMLAGLHLAFIVFTTNFVSTLTPTKFTGVVLALIGSHICFGLVGASRKVWGGSLGEINSADEEWQEVRNWFWTVAVSLAVTLPLVFLTPVFWSPGEYRNSIGRLLAMGIIASGLLTRSAVGRKVLSRN